MLPGLGCREVLYMLPGLGCREVLCILYLVWIVGRCCIVTWFGL